MTLYETMGWASTIAVLLPISLLLYFKLALYRSFPALLFFFGILFICNLLLLDIVGNYNRLRAVQDVLHNTLVAPLTIVFLSYFARCLANRRKMVLIAMAVLVYEVVVVSFNGFTDQAIRLSTAPGLLIALVFGLYFFAQQVKLTIMFQKALGKALLASLMLFATIGFSYIYVVRYFISPEYRSDADFFHFIVSLVVAVGVAVGLIFERKRVQQLEELRIAREELKEIYADEKDKEKATGPFGAVAFNFDNDSWN
ncbi:MAG: hypothetical protein NVV59_03140 [Chitinophagaceae bacterium]|nr:hypothetical protein [Chitinophagaceae bacterium]